MPRGGKRKGAGRKKGQNRIDKEMAREVIRDLVYAELEPLVTAQIANAKGIKYVVVREKKTGKFLRVGEGGAKLAAHEELIEVWEKDPSVQAFTDLLNRAIDKPKEQEQEIKVTGALELVSRLAAARKRIGPHDPA